MQSENTNIELLRNTIDIFMDVTGYRFLVKEQFITFLLDIPWYDVYFIQASQYVFYNLFLIQKWLSIEINVYINRAITEIVRNHEHMIFLWNIIFYTIHEYTNITISIVGQVDMKNYTLIITERPHKASSVISRLQMILKYWLWSKRFWHNESTRPWSYEIINGCLWTWSIWYRVCGPLITMYYA